jgi:NADH-ubiquinone oxidoreductase chain 4
MWYSHLIIEYKKFLTYQMFLPILLLVPLLGIFFISAQSAPSTHYDTFQSNSVDILYKKIALAASIFNLLISLIIYILFDFSTNQFQFVQEHYNLSYFDVYLGVDGLSIYFVLLTTIIMPIALLSN